MTRVAAPDRIADFNIVFQEIAHAQIECPCPTSRCRAGGRWSAPRRWYERQGRGEPHTVSANIGVVSNYVWRGLTQTDGGPAIQGGLDYEHASGLLCGDLGVQRRLRGW
ncbi:MAG: TorF family putative porin [Chromatiales bacterium]|nr:TorF family putative porin [Chromatiales bacterium]